MDTPSVVKITETLYRNALAEMQGVRAIQPKGRIERDEWNKDHARVLRNCNETLKQWAKAISGEGVWLYDLIQQVLIARENANKFTTLGGVSFDVARLLGESNLDDHIKPAVKRELTAAIKRGGNVIMTTGNDNPKLRPSGAVGAAKLYATVTHRQNIERTNQEKAQRIQNAREMDSAAYITLFGALNQGNDDDSVENINRMILAAARHIEYSAR